MLLGVEKVLQEKKPWLLMFSTALMAITNYFFLIGMTIAAFFYAIFRFFQRIKMFSFVENMKILGIGFVGFLTGILLTGFAVLPSVMVALEAPRASNSGYLEGLLDILKTGEMDQIFEYLFSWKRFGFAYENYANGGAMYRHAYPLINFFFPCASCRGTPLTRYENEYYDNVATNIYCYVPMMLTFIPAFTRAMKQKKWSVIVATVLFILALETPFAYYLFFGFTAPYGRWELFFITSFITFAGLHIDHINEDSLRIKVISYIATLVLIIAAGVVAQSLIDNNSHFYQRSDYISAPLATVIMVLYTSVVFFVLGFSKKEESRNSWMMTFIALEAAIMGFLTIEGHWCTTFEEANNGLEYNNDLYQLNQRIQSTDKSYYRCWSYLQNESARNDGMRNNYNGLGCFHSLYNFNINNFVNWTEIQDGETFEGGGSWAGSYVWKNQDIDKFLGVKYYFVQNNSPQWGWMGEYGSDYQCNVPLDFERVNGDFQSKKFFVYEDTKHLDFAFAFDNILNYDTMPNSEKASTEDMPLYGGVDGLINDEMLLRGAILKTEDAVDVMENYTNFTKTQLSTIHDTSLSKRKLLNYKYEVYDLETCTDGKQYSVNTFFEDYAQNYLNNHHALTAAQLVNIDDGSFAKVDSPEGANDKYGRYVSIIKPNAGTYFNTAYDKDGYALYIPYYYSETYRADIYLISDTGKIITWDRHQDDKYNIGGSKYRGFYVHATTDKDGNRVDAPKVAKIAFCHREKNALYQNNVTPVYYERYSELQTRYAKLYENRPTDVVYSTNKFTFKTNNTENLFYVTQMPWENGWSIKAKLADGSKKDVKIYSAQGGYVGFVAEKGEAEYVMEYYPKYLKEGKLISMVGAIIFLGSFMAFEYMTHEYKRKEKDAELFALN